MLGRLDSEQHALQWEGLIENVGVRLERRVDRNEIVGAVEFNAVPGVIDDSHVGITRPVAELAQRLAHFVGIQIQS